MHEFNGRLLICFTAGVALACSPDRDSTPTSPMAERAITATGPCDFRLVKSLANTEFAPKQQNTVQNLIKQMQAAYSRGNGAQATSLGFDVMQQIAIGLKNGTLTGSPENSSDLTIALIRCMEVSTSAPREDLDFTPAFTPGGGGAYEVRGLKGATVELPVYARDGGFSALQGPAHFAANGRPDGSNFFGWLGGRALIYGWPHQGDEFRTVETPVGEAYDWFVVTTGATPKPLLNGNGIVALCVGSPGSPVRIQHVSELTVFVNPFTDVAGWAENSIECPSVTAGASARGSLPFVLVRRALEAGFRLASPRPAHAALAFRATGGGGSVGSLSPSGGVILSGVTFEGEPSAGGFASSPANGPAGKLTPQPTFHVETAKGTPIPGVTILLEVRSNSGSFKVCRVSDRTPLTLPITFTTDDDGDAGFTDLAIDKPGGYTMKATTRYAGYPDAVAESPLFNLSQSSFACN